MTREDISKEETNTFVLYQAAKTVAERELWKFADEHPEIDITTSKNILTKLESRQMLTPFI